MRENCATLYILATEPSRGIFSVARSMAIAPASVAAHQRSARNAATEPIVEAIQCARIQAVKSMIAWVYEGRAESKSA